MTGFPLGGFGFFKTRLGVGTYNRERKATILRQFDTEKDALWGGGIRVPIWETHRSRCGGVDLGHHQRQKTHRRYDDFG